MTPIEKNIRVVDEQGHEYEATYPKRAKGLVKNGRARFIDENTLCLACPPDKMEEKRMSDNQNCQSVEKAIPASADVQNVQIPAISYSLEYALQQLEIIRAESAAFTEKLFDMIANSKSCEPGEKALETFAKEHEATMQKQIDFYQNMVKELTPFCMEEQEK